jgi:hypothetical protein
LSETRGVTRIAVAATHNTDIGSDTKTTVLNSLVESIRNE